LEPVEFVDSDIHVESSSIWATFADGQQIVIANNLELPAPPVLPEPRPQRGRQVEPPPLLEADELPRSDRVCLLETLGFGFPSILDDVIVNWTPLLGR